MALVGDTYKDTLSIDINGVSITNKQNEYVITLWLSKDINTHETFQYFLNLTPQVTLIADPVYQSCLFLMKSNS